MKLSSIAIAAFVALPSVSQGQQANREMGPALQQLTRVAAQSRRQRGSNAPKIPAARAVTDDTAIKGILPVPTEGYYRTRTTMTFNLIDSTTRKPAGKVGPLTRTGLTAKFGDGRAIFMFVYLKWFIEDSGPVLSLTEYVRTPKETQDEYTEWRDGQSFIFNSGGNELVKSTSNDNVQMKDLGNGTLRYTDPTGNWGMGKDAVSVSTKKVKANGDEDQTTTNTKMNQFGAANRIVTKSVLKSSLKVSTKDDFLGAFPQAVQDFLKQFATLHIKAVKAHETLDRCAVSNPPGQNLCETLSKEYEAADLARHDYWSKTLDGPDLYQLVPNESVPQD